ncbi:putative NADH-flavin reductase [Rivularia sp. PCC 7116]|uniref:NAD(P)-dependent oxidoreductase n=1 Tax=Rivularia sp. PCC 7116 TaxID=373994 RepID=UPI00029F19AD|nr:SDR family oxidoreductase [Rivularia sp. PCC 7116]AFY56852.1 putative NADH-flavin reductase [Rivularia sp. PCC 7116]
MNLLIFGATGSVGCLVVEQALEKGHMVTAFVRNPEKLDIKHENLQVVKGDVMDTNSVEKAVQGKDAVVCVLGAGKKTKGTIRSEGTQQIIKAMEKAGIQRLICQSTLGAGDSWENLNFFWKYIMFGFLLRDVFKDHEKQEDYVKQSKLNWTIIRPSAFIDGEQTGNYRHGFSGDDQTSKLKISRADVADFILKQLTDKSYLYKTPALSY